MKLRYPVLLVIVLVLVVANVWIKIERDGMVTFEEISSSSTRKFLVSDFDLKGLSIDDKKSDKVNRDLFYPLINESHEIVKEALKNSGKDKNFLHNANIQEVSMPLIAPHITSNLLAVETEAAKDDLAKFKYVGILFHGERREASLLFSDQHYIVSAGDKLGSRFIVDNITTDAVSVSDPVTKISGQIRISGSSEIISTK